MNAIRVDLFSDTTTRPSRAMREFMSSAEVGDEQLGEDPSVNALQDMVAGLLDKDAGLYLPSGTMCNEISFAVHCRPGDEIIMDASAHPLNYEGGGPAAITGALIRPLAGHRGIFSADRLRASIRPDSRYHPRSRAVSVEQTTNLGGGACWPLETMTEVCAVAKEAGLGTHLDGARLMNAVVATGTEARDFAGSFDSAWIDLSKGLGAPVGAVLAAGGDFISEAWRLKQRFGGAMRQAGIIAAAGIYALRNNVERLADDHVNARRLAQGLSEIDGIDIDPTSVVTNILLFEVASMDATDFSQRMQAEHGVRFSQVSGSTLRAVTHLDVDRDGIDHAIAAARAVLG